ncbi:hypothetical protein JCM8547_001029 [Rhodosporidiobolus lusitaniae]
MPHPIADQYTSRLSAHSASSPGLSSSSSGRQSRSTHRTSISFKPSDDPFAPSSIFQEHLQEEPEDDWRRISEERPSQENGKAMRVEQTRVWAGHSEATKENPQRRPSFLKSLLHRQRPRRARSSLQLSSADISSPILSPTSPPPRVGPLRTRASLVSFGDITATNYSGFSYPSGSNSLRGRPSSSSVRPGLDGAFDNQQQPAHSRSNTVRIDAHPPLAGSLRRPASAMELLPPTASSKAFSLLGGPRLTEENRKAVEKLTGVRTSVFSSTTSTEDEDNTISALGLALTTDAPTRRIVPDNARYSLASFSTIESAFDRSTQYSSTSGSFSRPGISPRKNSPVGEQFEDPQEEDEEKEQAQQEQAIPLRRSVSMSSSRPLSPPPNVPLPPLPVGVGNVPARPKTGESSASSATMKPPPPPSLPSSSAPARPAIPPRSAKRLAAISQTLPPPTNPSSLKRSASPSRQPVSSSSLPPSVSFAPPPPIGPVKPLASLYLVAGLPKDPSAWTVATHGDVDAGGREGGGVPEHVKGAVPRFWKPEVLGLQVSGEGGNKEGAKELISLSREEVQKVQSKAVKLAFDRDVEIVSSASQPSATTSIFSFTLTTSSSGLPLSSLSGSPSASFSSSRSSASSTTTSTTYHCVSLLVWSHADSARSTAIRASLAQGAAEARAEAIKRAAKAARAGKKLGEKLARQMSSPMGINGGAREWANGLVSDTEGETEANFTESEWEFAAAATPAFDTFPSSTPLWLPYSLILISTLPLFDLLSDVLRLSWAHHHQDIASHSLAMERVLNTPAPRPGETVKVPVSIGEKHKNTFFVATIPGELDWSSGLPVRQNFPLWPIFQALHVDNLLTIAELALAPLGKVLFTSRYPLMLGLATLTFRTILESRGWKGITHALAHVRDLRLYLDDPGPWLIGLPFPSRPLVLADLAPEIVLVDLDANQILCSQPSPGAITTGATRDKARKKLEAAIGMGVSGFGVAEELKEAFPGGRFRPFSLVEVAGQPRDAERLKPSWVWDEARVLKAFDAVLSEIPRTGLSRLFGSKRQRKFAELDKGALHVQTIVRKHADHLVDRRDMLEAKVNKANQKLAALIHETEAWQRSFEVFEEFSEKITHESARLKTRLEEEQRRAKRLTGQLLGEQESKTRLEASLVELEQAKEQALNELSTVAAVRQQLEQQQSLLHSEIQNILLTGEDETSPLFQAVYARVESLSQRSHTPSFSRPSTSLSVRSTSRLARQPSFFNERDAVIPEEEEEHLADGNDFVNGEVDEEQRLEAMKLAVQETFRSISSRLSIALHTVGQVDGLVLTPPASDGNFSPRPSISTFPSFNANHYASPPSSLPSRPPPSPDIGPFSGPASPSSPSSAAQHGFLPKPLTLTLPITPDLDSPASSCGPTPSSFVTVRPPHRRIPSAASTSSSSAPHQHQHLRQLSLSSTLSSSSSSASTPTAASLAHSLVRSASSASRQQRQYHPTGLVRQASFSPAWGRSRSASNASASTARGAATDYSTDDDAQSFVTISEGGGYGYGYGGEDVGRAGEGEGEDVFELEELAYTVHQQEREKWAAEEQEEEQEEERNGSSGGGASMKGAAVAAPHRPGGHGRQDSFSIDAPPVQLFTRSVRGRRGGGSLGGSVGGSVDWGKQQVEEQ